MLHSHLFLRARIRTKKSDGHDVKPGRATFASRLQCVETSLYFPKDRNGTYILHKITDEMDMKV
jgi:hypothetical protein